MHKEKSCATFMSLEYKIGFHVSSMYMTYSKRHIAGGCLTNLNNSNDNRVSQNLPLKFGYPFFLISRNEITNIDTCGHLLVASQNFLFELEVSQFTLTST